MEIPEHVEKTYLKLKTQYSSYIVLKVLGGRYYVYEQNSLWDRINKKVKIKSNYLGRITNDGAFIKKASSKEEKQLEISKAFIETHGGKISWVRTNEEKEGTLAPSEIDDKLLTELSVNARENTSEISKKVGLSIATVTRRIKRLEEMYGIKYTIDATLDRFHLYQYVAIAKFIDERPTSIELKELIVKNSRIRLALSTRGAYDLFLFMLVKEPLEAEEIVYELRSTSIFSKYPAKWYVSYHSQAYGFIPLREEFFDMLKERVWKRTKEQPRKKPDQLYYREYATTRELNNNSSIAFNLIDEKYKLKHGSAQNIYHKLIEDGSIRSATITMDKPPIKSTAVIILEQTDVVEFNKSRKEYFKYRLADDKNAPLNKFIFSGDIGSPYGLLVIAPIYKNGDLERLEAELSQVARGTIMETSLVSDILVGNLGYRKISSKHTHLYKRLQEIEQQETTKESDSP